MPRLSVSDTPQRVEPPKAGYIGKGTHRGTPTAPGRQYVRAKGFPQSYGTVLSGVPICTAEANVSPAAPPIPERPH